MRKFMPNRQSVADVNTRLDKIIIKTSGVSGQGALGYVYAQKKLKLPVLSLPQSMDPQAFIDRYDIPLYTVSNE